MLSVRRPSARSLLLAVPPVALAAAGWAHRWVAEDGFIYFRVVKQIEAGNGPVFNVGQRVETHTDTLWTAVLLVGDLLLPLPLEWVSVVLGLALAVAGVICAQLAALRWQPEGDHLVLPFGSAAIVSVAAVWHFSTAGLDGGLVFGWLGASLLAMTVGWPSWRAGERGPRWVLVLVGLGTLTRPDVGLFAAGWLLLAVAVLPSPRRRTAASMLGWALALPLAYEVFRAAYYGQLVPNSAVAKEAGRVDVSSGLIYLGDLAGSYALAAVGVLVAVALVRTWRGGADLRLLAVTTAGLGLLHGGYIVAMGGDYMHARLLLPSLFAIGASVAVLSVRARTDLAALALLVSWCGVASLFLRPPPLPGNFVFADRFDMRALQVQLTRHEHPVTLEQQRRSIWGRHPQRLARIRDERGGDLVLFDRTSVLDDRYDHPYAVVIDAVGIAAYSEPLDVLVIDQLGLADVTVSHTTPVQGRPGHVKVGTFHLLIARYAQPGQESGPPANDPLDAGQLDQVAQLRALLDCAEVRDLVDATEAPLDLARAWRNLVGAPRRTVLRFTQEPWLDPGPDAGCP